MVKKEDLFNLAFRYNLIISLSADEGGAGPRNYLSCCYLSLFICPDLYIIAVDQEDGIGLVFF